MPGLNGVGAGRHVLNGECPAPVTHGEVGVGDDTHILRHPPVAVACNPQHPVFFLQANVMDHPLHRLTDIEAVRRGREAVHVVHQRVAVCELHELTDPRADDSGHKDAVLLIDDNRLVRKRHSRKRPLQLHEDVLQAPVSVGRDGLLNHLFAGVELPAPHDLQAPHRAGHAHGPKAHDGTITTEAPDVMWGTDMSATVTVGEGAAFVFVAVDHCTTECIGLHAAKSASRFEALEPIRQGVRERFGAIAKGVARGLRLRHDHGSNYLADDFQREIKFFGIESSPSFVREPEGAQRPDYMWDSRTTVVERSRTNLVL